MSPKFDPNASLGYIIEQFLGPIEHHLISASEPGLTRALGNWYRLNFVIAASSRDADELLACMSEQQHVAYQVLFDWWTASYCDSATSLASILDIVSQCGSLEDEDEEDGAWNHVIQHLQLKQWPVPGIEVKLEKLVDPDSRTYNVMMRRLWATEFEHWLFTSEMTQVALTTIRRHREQASMRAWCQRISWECLMGNAAYNSSIEEVKAEQVLSILAPLATTDAGSPPIQACSWLNTGNNSDLQLPYYLWSRCAKVTVQTAELEQMPRYTAISHTWGRWRTPGLSTLPGVSWQIPQNTKFDVDDLPNILDAVPTETPYIWLDLVCIPQDGSTIAEQEIARQADIFKGAQCAVAWVNEAPDFNCLGSVLRGLALQMITLPEGSRKEQLRDDMVKKELASLELRPTNLLIPRRGELTKSTLIASSWFTSLWTLQELCLRPDMWLCDKEWRPLRLNETAPLSISGIIVLKEIYERHFVGRMFQLHDDQVQVALWELDWWRNSTGLDRLNNFSRLDIMAWGDRRHCTSRRAEAIMSALGVTKWYGNGNHEEDSTQLVYHKYPAEFVQELMERNPGEFFCTFIKQPWADLEGTDTEGNISDEDDTDEYDDEQRCGNPSLLSQLKGGLLPFSEKGAVYINHSFFQHQNFDSHQSLYTWRILSSGEVKVQSACVIASSVPSLHPKGTSKLRSKFAGFRCRNAPNGNGSLLDTNDDEGFSVDLQTWAQTRTYEVHAVVCSCSESVVYAGFDPGYGLGVIPPVTLRQAQGLILCRFDETHLAKLGLFHVSDDEDQLILPDATNVDWLVC